MAREDLVCGITTQVVNVGLSAISTVGGLGGQVYSRLRYISGGTLSVYGTSAGVTTGTAGYLVGATETLELKGPAKYYLLSGGATTVVHLIFGLSQGNEAT